MKGAQALIVCASFLEFYVLPNHINDVNPIQKIGNEGLWDERHKASMKLFSLFGYLLRERGFY